MDIEKLKKANRLRDVIKDYDDDIAALEEIKEATSNKDVHCRVSFLETKTIYVSRAEARFILEYLLERWKANRKERVDAFEQL